MERRGKAYRTIACIVAAIICCTSNMTAQKIWSLEECISYACNNNISVKQQELAHRQNLDNLTQSQLSYIPNVNLSIGHNFNWGRSVDMQELVIIKNKLTQATSASANLSTPLFNGFSNYFNIKNNKLQIEISAQNIEKLKNDISISITRAYLQLLLSKQLLSNARVSYENILNQRNKTEKLVNAGSQPYSSLLEIEAQVASENAQVVSAAGTVQSNILALTQLMNIPYSEDFEIAAPPSEMVPQIYKIHSFNDIYHSTLSLPEIKSAEYALESSKVKLSQAKWGRFPSISLSAGYGSYYSSAAESAFKQQFIDNRNPSIGIGLSVPIFNGYQAASRVKSAEIGVQNSIFELQARHQTLQKEVQTAIIEADNAYQKSVAAYENLRAMEESFRMSEQKYENGAITSTDYIIAKTNVTKARAEYELARFQYIFQEKIIDYYKGIPITL